jgi:hypothetical protein
MYWPIYVETLHAYNQGTVPAFIVETNYEWDNNTQVEPNDASCSYPNRASSCVYEYLIRKQFYWAMTGGANAGYLTGAYPFSTAQPTFQSGFSRYLTSTGEANFVRWKSLFTANDLPWFALVPDQTGTLVTAGRGTPFSASGSCIANSHTCETQDAYVTVATASTPTDTWGVIYIPCYATNSTYGCAGTGGVTVAMSALGPAITAQWYDPTNGHHATIAGSPFTNRGTRTFTPAQTNSAGDPDWVLILHGGGRPRPHALSG